MTPKINRRLHLVIPVEQEGRTLYVHSTPLGAEVFDSFFLPLAKTFAAINGEGLGVLAGPRVAAHVLKAVSTRLGIWESDDPADATVKIGVMAEIRRLTNVFVPGLTGWQMLPLDTVVSNKTIDAEDASEVENIITFFTVIWLMHKKGVREQVMTGAAELWGGQLTSSSCTAFRDSLPTSTPGENTGATTA